MTTEIQEPGASRAAHDGNILTFLSRDGLLLWNGTDWVPTPYVRPGGQWWTGDRWEPGGQLSDDGRWRLTAQGWVPAASLSPDRRWVWSGFEWYEVPVVSPHGDWATAGWVALALALLSAPVSMFISIGIADAQVSGVETGVEDLAVLAFTLPGAIVGGIAAGSSWRSDPVTRTVGLFAVSIALATSALLALLLLG